MKTSKNLIRSSARRAGFSLAELMVVIVIIGMLGTIVVPKLMERFGGAQIGVAKTEIGRISDAVIDFRVNEGRFPESLEELVTKTESGTSYLDGDVVPTDPWGNEYILEIEDDDVLIWTLGADGQQGGEGKDLDFNNKMIRNKEV